MGSLSPRTRNAQVDLFQNGDVEFLVATDAIGMGLNLDVTHVAFASDSKYDGRQFRPLTPAEIGQIAGRAGRHMRDGTFGVTGGTDSFDEETIAALEAHDFAPVKQLQWRNRDLDFSSLSALHNSLEVTPEHPALTRVPVATDQRALEFLLRREEGQLANSRERVEMAWACCQIPDFRDISPAAHGEIVTRVFSGLALAGRIDADWIAEQVRFCDNTVATSIRCPTESARFGPGPSFLTAGTGWKTPLTGRKRPERSRTLCPTPCTKAYSAFRRPADQCADASS